MVKALKKTGQLKKCKLHDMDYDNQVQPTEKYDAEKTYKKTYGYQPGIASIANSETGQVMPVYIEVRNGNSQANKLFQKLQIPQESRQYQFADLVDQHKIQKQSGPYPVIG